MNVTTITIDRAFAQEKLREYAHVLKRTIEDELMLDAYRAAARGDRLINVHEAFRTTGLKDGAPRLAMARADWQQCVFHPSRSTADFSYVRGGGLFTYARRIPPQLRVNYVGLPRGTFDAAALAREVLVSPVPHIPPAIRPRPSALTRYFILFEVEKWERYPADPFLLKHIAGPFYSVEAEWELSPLEISLLSVLVP